MWWEGMWFFQTHSREQGSLFWVIVSMYLLWWEGGVWLFQTHRREQGSLFLVILAMNSNLTGRGGGGLYDSFRHTVENKDHCFELLCILMRWEGGGGLKGSFRHITENIEQGSVFLVIVAVYHDVLGRGIWFFVYCREQKSLPSDFLYVLWCHGKRGGVRYGSLRHIV